MGRFICAHCGFEKKTDDNYVGRKARCPECEGLSVVREDEASAAATPQVPSPIENESASQPYVDRRIAIAQAQMESRGDKLPGWAAAVLFASWACLAVGMVIGLLMFLASLAQSTGAPQEAAVGAVFSALFIAGYILTRCIEKTVKAITRR